MRYKPHSLFQNGHHFSILLFSYKLALVASFKGKYSFENEATRGNLEEKKNTIIAAILE